MNRYSIVFLLTVSIALVWTIGRGFSKEVDGQVAEGHPRAGLSMAVISDIHVMAPSLLLEDGTAFADYLKQDRKMLKESAALLDELTRQLIEARPQMVLLTGDLTKDGEAVSHDYVRRHCLDILREAGIPTLVIPGNHDINNPHAVSFDGATTERVATVSADEFAAIYADYGYGDALSRDTASLTYVYQLAPGLRMLAIDACEYDLNDYEQNTCRHEGRIRPATWDFIAEELDRAKREGQYVLAMMHHGLMEHWKYQNRLIPGYVVDDCKRLRRLLKRGGVEVIFTGHAHTQDVTCTHGVYDVETGSTVSYPSPYRLIQLKGNTMTIQTRRLTDIDFDLGGCDLQRYGREATGSGFRSIAAALLPDNLPEELRTRALQFGAEAMCDNYGGDEQLTDSLRQEIKAICRDMRRYSWKWSIAFGRLTRSVLSDKNTADNDLLIHLHNE